ncbi:DUF6199 family natural product biosynthesis protein (plasmid) [Streptomyces sp. NBC_00028]|uniref:DUF6199 family natural product biosynthesis protein n=1 Tax=Streptomyces sp. NBC_00028 TaxID=2975624 RepID=UPI002F910A45
MVVVLLCVFIAIGLVQVFRPQLLWKANRPLQRPFVKDFDATEPTKAGYAMSRFIGVLFLAMATWMLITHLN